MAIPFKSRSLYLSFPVPVGYGRVGVWLGLVGWGEVRMVVVGWLGVVGVGWDAVGWVQFGRVGVGGCGGWVGGLHVVGYGGVKQGGVCIVMWVGVAEDCDNMLPILSPYKHQIPQLANVRCL